MNKSRAVDVKCPSCSAPLKYNSKTSNWTCEYCRSSFSLEELKEKNVIKDDEVKTSAKKSIKKDDTTYIKYFCQNCNAEIIADEQTAATFCVYCGNTAILKEKLTGEFAPSMIIPFKVEKQSAIDAFIETSKNKPFMPDDFNNTKNIEKITGVYIPFWLYDVDAEGEIIGKATTTNTWTSGDTTYVRTKEYLCTREGSASFKKIPVDASTRFDNAIMNSIEPFDYSELVDYNHAYLSGFLAEKYDDDPKEAEKTASNRAINTLENIMKQDISSKVSVPVITKNTLAPKNIKSSYVLLPVWMLNVKYGDKMYPFAMNAQSGKFIGNVPVDTKKVIKKSIIVFLISLVSCLLLSLIIYYIKGGRL